MSEQSVSDKAPSAENAATEASAAVPVGEKELSNKELKELKKKEKAAKRAAQKKQVV